MIRRLKTKFVILVSVSLLLLLSSIVAGMNLINYSRVVEEADMVLGFLGQDRGDFPMDFEKPAGRLPPGMSPEIPYESRFFSVTIDGEGKVIEVENSRIISVDEADAITY